MDLTPQLYIIATPLGNLEDLTLRARRLFEELDCFFAEDSREFKKLLNMLNIALQGKQVFSYAAHNMKAATEQAIRLLHEGKSLGFVTDRGTPGISDPGAMLVARAHEEGIRVVPVPGPSAISALLSSCGHTDGRFYFQGFLPSTRKEREEIYAMTSAQQISLCFFESPHRIRETIREFRERFPLGRIFLGREMTKMFETLTWHSLSELKDEEILEKGEYSGLLVPGVGPQAEEAWREEVLNRSLSEKEWAKKVSTRFSINASDIYNALQQIKKK